MTAAQKTDGRVAELRRLVAEAETNAGVEALIATARVLVKAWNSPGITATRRFDAAIIRLEELVGRP